MKLVPTVFFIRQPVVSKQVLGAFVDNLPHSDSNYYAPIALTGSVTIQGLGFQLGSVCGKFIVCLCTSLFTMVKQRPLEKEILTPEAKNEP